MGPPGESCRVVLEAELVERRSLGDVDLCLDEVYPRGHLRDRVLDLQPRVDLEEVVVP
jgi:hypothetical protein